LKKSDKANSQRIRQIFEVENFKKRIPDTEHLTRLRAILIAAHQNDAFIK